MTTPTEIPASTTGRDDHGRFARNNPGGPGNPFARQVARLRQVLLNGVTAEDMAVIAHKLIDLAKDGNVQAIKLLFSYTLGKPPATEPPDQLDIQEWQLFRQSATMAEELPGLVATPDPSLPLQMVRAARPAMASDMSRQLSEALRAGAEQERKRQEQREQRRQQTIPGEKHDQKAPSTNGRNGRPVVAERVVDPAMRRSLEALATRDSQALRGLDGADPECPPVAQLPPSANGCNGTRPPAGEKTPPHNGNDFASDGFGHSSASGDRG
jgi:hypothetical protein